MSPCRPVTRLADRLVAAGHVTRGSAPGHRGVVTLDVTGTGRLLAGKVASWRQQELARTLAQLEAADRVRLAAALRRLVAAAGDRYGITSRTPLPV